MSKGGHNRIKDNTHDCKVIDIINWQREGYLNGSHSFNWIWTTTTGESRGDISVETTPDYARLIYTVTDRWNDNKRDIDYKIPLSWTPCNYGGQRAWFVCKCGRRAIKLYLKNDYFYCRYCQRLNYYSQQQSNGDQKMNSIRERIYKIQKKLKTEQDNNNTYYAPKPKGMHYKKYEQLLKQMRELGELQNRVFVSESVRRFGMTFLNYSDT